MDLEGTWLPHRSLTPTQGIAPPLLRLVYSLGFTFHVEPHLPSELSPSFPTPAGLNPPSHLCPLYPPFLQAEEREAREKRYAQYHAGLTPASGNSRVLAPSAAAEAEMLMMGSGGRGEMLGADGGGFYPQGGDGGAEGAGHHQSGGSTGVQQGGTAGGAPADGRFHAFPLTPMDEAGLRLRGLALRRGARADVEDSDVSARGWG